MLAGKNMELQKGMTGMDKVSLFVAIWAACPIAGAVMGHMMKARPIVGFLLGAGFGLFGLVFLHFAPSRLRNCKYCKSKVDLHAIKCPNCGSDFNNPGVPGVAFFDERKPRVGYAAKD
jgi:hypothetical protein